jgi:hypothetical protein
MCAFPVSGQPPTVIFCVHGATRAADRTLQQRLGMEQRPEAHCQAALPTAGRARTVIGGKGMPGWPNIRLSHLFSFTGQWVSSQPGLRIREGRDQACRRK